jgi:hypothetical protein
MTSPFDLTYFGYGCGIILLGFLVGYGVGAILNVVNKLGWFCLLLFAFMFPINSQAAEPEIYASYTLYGIQMFDTDNLSHLIHSLTPVIMVGNGKNIYASWTGSGLWKYDGVNWIQLSSADPLSVSLPGIDYQPLYQILSLLIGSLSIVAFAGGVIVGRMV